MAKKQIRLNEEKLRNFISYSVARLLKEGNGFNGFAGRPIYDSYGEYDGSEGSKYGSSDVEVPFYEWANSQNNSLAILFDSANEEHGGQFTEILKSENDYLDLLSTIYGNLGDEDITLCVDFTYSKGMKGDGYIQPDDPDELTINKSYLKQPETNQALQKMDPMYREFMTAVASEWADGWVDEDYIYNNYVEDTIMEEKNLGITTHFDGNSSFQPKNPYEDMTWDEYCAMKKKEREDDKEKKLLHDLNYPDDNKDRKRNRGIMTHVPGKKGNSIKLTQQDLAEMIGKAVCQLKESLSLPGYDAWKTRTPYDDEPSIISKDDFFENIAQDGDPGRRYNQCKEFLEWLADYDQEVYEKVMQENQATGENVFDLAINNGIDWKEIARDFYYLTPVNYYKDDMYESAGKKPVNEISKGLLDRAREAAHKDMMRNFGDSKIRNKRDRQWRKFGDEYRKMDRQEKDSICPQVDERDLANMPEGTYVVMNGDGRDAVSANFRTSYSGRAGTKEQCEEYVKRFYDAGANWEYLPEIVPLEDYLNSKHRR